MYSLLLKIVAFVIASAERHAQAHAAKEARHDEEIRLANERRNASIAQQAQARGLAEKLRGVL